jgi:hypothetical protein
MQAGEYKNTENNKWGAHETANVRVAWLLLQGRNGQNRAF